MVVQKRQKVARLLFGQHLRFDIFGERAELGLRQREREQVVFGFDHFERELVERPVLGFLRLQLLRHTFGLFELSYQRLAADTNELAELL